MLYTSYLRVCLCVSVMSQEVLCEVCHSRGLVITVDSNPTDGLAASISRSGGVVSQYGAVTLFHPRIFHCQYTLSP